MSASRIFDTLYAAKFLNLLQKDFTRWDAYRLGVIDRKGNIEKKPESAQEKKAFSHFHKLVATVKGALDRVPGATSLASVYTAYKTFVEEYGVPESDHLLIIESVPELGDLLSESVVAGDAGGSPDNIAKGQTSGAVTYPGPTSGKKKKKDKDKKTFEQFIESIK